MEPTLSIKKQEMVKGTLTISCFLDCPFANRLAELANKLKVRLRGRCCSYMVARVKDWIHYG